MKEYVKKKRQVFTRPRVGLFAILIGLTLGGCSTFEAHWQSLAGKPIPTDDIHGRWIGRWESEATGHDGELRCIVKQLDDNVYEARFHAVYASIFAFAYDVLLTPERRQDLIHFSGEENLGYFAGGVYEFNGSASPARFYCTYRSANDHGLFEMSRPGK